MDTMSERVISMAEANSNHVKAICDAALKLFQKNGYEDVSVNDICKEAGIARSTFYLNFANKKEIVAKLLDDARVNHEDFLGDFVEADNDFERMWILCNRYLDVVIDFGPELTATVFELELMGELDVLDTVHTIDEWFVTLTKNAQSSGVILGADPPEILAPLGVDIAYYTTYEWCKRGGSFDLRKVVRRRAEALYTIAPEHRMSDEELEKL